MPDNERTLRPDKNYRVTYSGRVEVNTTALVYAHLDAQKKTMENERTPLEQKIGTCTQCGDPVYPSTAAFEGATKTCYDCWGVDDMGETGYEGDGA